MFNWLSTHYLSAIFFIASELLTCYICFQLAEKEYTEAALAKEVEYRERMQDADLKASKISEQYLEASNELENINRTNERLVNRLQQLERAAQRGNQNTGCAVKYATCPDISSRMAEHVTDIVKRADGAALYAQKCYEWVRQLQKEKLTNQTPK